MTKCLAVIVAVVGIGLFAGNSDTWPSPNSNMMTLAGEPPAAEAQQMDLPKQSITDAGRGSALQAEPIVPAKVDAASFAADARPATVPGGYPPRN